MVLPATYTCLPYGWFALSLQAEIEAARITGQKPTTVILADGSALKVPLGQERVTNPADGNTYAVKWTQDDAGKLAVLDCKLISKPAADARQVQVLAAPGSAIPLAAVQSRGQTSSSGGATANEVVVVNASGDVVMDGAAGAGGMPRSSSDKGMPPVAG